MRTIWAMISSTISRVSSWSSMPKPFCSVVDDPRPMPELEAAIGQVVEHGDPLGDPGRVVDRRA